MPIDARRACLIGASLAAAFVSGVLVTLGVGRLSAIFSSGPCHDDAPEEDIRQGIEGCIGNTPLIRIKSLSEATGCDLLAKAEFLNGAGGSPKDRVALRLINQAEQRGALQPHSGDTIFEGSVGSTGISLATLCRARGYRAHICMPDDQSVEKYDLLEKLGAEVSRVRPAPIVDPNHFVNVAASLAEQRSEDPTIAGRGYFADQFNNEANWQAHYDGTGPEIFRQTGGRLDAFVAGAGTGGTITGVARYVKSRLASIQVVLADPEGSGLFNRVKYGVMFDPKEKEGSRRRHQVDTIVDGIGLNRVAANFEAGRPWIDDAIRVSDAQALAMARWLVEKDGIFAGSSSCVNCESDPRAGACGFVRELTETKGVAAVQVARRLGPGHRIVTILCDSGSRHLSKFWASAGNVHGQTDMTLEAVLTAQ